MNIENPCTKYQMTPVQLKPGRYVMFRFAGEEEERLGRILRESSTRAQVWVSFITDQGMLCSPVSRTVTMRRPTPKELFAAKLKGIIE